MMRPLARWTIGPVTPTGKEILHQGVKSFHKLYPEFDKIICYNNIDQSEVANLACFADLFEQTGLDVGCRLSSPEGNLEEAVGSGWKFSPPRLRIESHELYLDNDIIFRGRLAELDVWLSSSVSVISEGQGRKRMYGVFDHHVPSGVHVCAGFFGLPPNFDFKQKICELAVELGEKPLGGYDEQGLTSSIVMSITGHMIIPKTSVMISEDHVPLPSELAPVIHFVGANRKEWHRGWKEYKRRSMLLL